MIDHPLAAESEWVSPSKEEATRMSTQQAIPPEAQPRTPRGEGWVVFAIVYLGLVGILNVIYGIAALSNKDYFRENSLLWSNLKTWGWVLIVLGAFQILTAGAIYARTAWGAILGIFLASLAFIANFLSIGAYPAWSIIAMVLSGFVIWGLSASMSDRADSY
jgi:hypothetical protein